MCGRRSYAGHAAEEKAFLANGVMHKRCATARRPAMEIGTIEDRDMAAVLDL
jgi:hypothetical protein